MSCDSLVHLPQVGREAVSRETASTKADAHGFSTQDGSRGCGSGGEPAVGLRTELPAHRRSAVRSSFCAVPVGTQRASELLFRQSQHNSPGLETRHQSRTRASFGMLTNILEGAFSFCRVGGELPVWAHTRRISHVKDMGVASLFPCQETAQGQCASDGQLSKAEQEAA